MEIWKDVPGYEGHYQVSNMGRVKSIKFGREKILKQMLHFAGSDRRIEGTRVYLSLRGRRKCICVHNLVTLTFFGERNPGDIQVNHIDEDPTNNHLENLEYVTRRQNSNHSRAKKSTSPYSGVCWNTARQKWIASIRVDKKKVHLGHFDNELEAAKAYWEKYKEIEGYYPTHALNPYEVAAPKPKQLTLAF